MYYNEYVAPTGLAEIYFWFCYKYVAPTELIQKIISDVATTTNIPPLRG